MLLYLWRTIFGCAHKWERLSGHTLRDHDKTLLSVDQVHQCERCLAIKQTRQIGGKK